MEKTQYLKDWRESRFAMGLCRNCDTPIDGQYKLCPGCKKRAASSVANKRAARVSNGLCGECGKSPPDPGKKTCSACISLAANHTRERRIRYREAGICEQCGKEPAVQCPDRSKGAFCEVCWLKQAARIHLGTAKRWPELLALFVEQHVCPYTGHRLQIGVNASLDHKVPKSEGGTNDMHNLQWVYNSEGVDVNRMKGELSEEDFIATVNRIAKEQTRPRCVMDLTCEIDLTCEVKI